MVRHLCALLLIATLSAGCVRVVEIENTPGHVTSVGPIDGAGPFVVVSYTVRDLEGDDQTVRFVVCEQNGDDCGPAIAAPGGDPTERVPTVPEDSDALHEFWWNPWCGRFVDGERVESELTADYVIRVSILDTDQEPLESEPFTLEQLQLDEGDCELSD